MGFNLLELPFTFKRLLYKFHITTQSRIQILVDPHFYHPNIWIANRCYAYFRSGCRTQRGKRTPSNFKSTFQKTKLRDRIGEFNNQVCILSQCSTKNYLQNNYYWNSTFCDSHLLLKLNLPRQKNVYFLVCHTIFQLKLVTFPEHF